MAGSRSKSPKGRKKSAGSAFDMNDANVQLGITVAALGGLVFLTQGGVNPDNWFSFFDGEGITIPFWPFGGFVLTMHCLNSCQGAGNGYWVGSFVNAVIATFAGVIVPEIAAGKSCSLFADEGTLTLCFVCWYLTNHNLPLVDFDAWGTVSGLGGSALQSIMDLCSLVFTTKLIMAGAGTTAASGWFGFSIFVPMTFGVLAGTAADFFPLNKGIKITNSASAKRAARISFFLATNGFAALPFVGEAVGGVVSQATGVFGGNANFVLAVTILNHLFGHFVPMNPLDQVEDAFYKVTGLSR